MTREDALAHLTGESRAMTPIRGRWTAGASQPGDIIWTTLALPVLLSERVVDLLRQGGFSGWDVLPVELSDRTGGRLPKYYYLRVHGSCGPIDKSRSTKVDKVYPGGVFPVWKGLYFDEATWDGSDLFIAAGTGFKFVVEEVKRNLQRAKVKNVLFTPLCEIELETMDA